MVSNKMVSQKHLRKRGLPRLECIAVIEFPDSLYVRAWHSNEPSIQGTIV